MIGQRRKAGCQLLPEAASACLRHGVLAIALLVAFAADAQQGEQQPPNDVADNPSPEQANPSARPGFIDSLGRWIGESKAVIDSHLKNSQDAMSGIGAQATDAVKDAAAAAQQATGAVVGLAASRLVTGRQVCPPAPNGAPDCGPAADALCQAKGFGSGRGLEVASRQSCSTRIWLSRRNPSDGPCGTETFVTRAVCQ